MKNQTTLGEIKNNSTKVIEKVKKILKVGCSLTNALDIKITKQQKVYLATKASTTSRQMLAQKKRHFCLNALLASLRMIRWLNTSFKKKWKAAR